MAYSRTAAARPPTRSPCRRSRSSSAIRRLARANVFLASGGIYSGHADFMDGWKHGAVREARRELPEPLQRLRASRARRRSTCRSPDGLRDGEPEEERRSVAAAIRIVAPTLESDGCEIGGDRPRGRSSRSATSPATIETDPDRDRAGDQRQASGGDERAATTSRHRNATAWKSRPAEAARVSTVW